MALEAQVTAMEGQAQVVAGLNLGEMWDRYLGEFLGEWTRKNREGIRGSELENALLDFMESLSSAPVEDVARKAAGVAYNQGRSAEILSAATEGEVGFVVRSEILDQNTCSECLIWDGAVFEVGTPDYFAYMPPARCLGGDRCRGFYVAVPVAA